MNGIDTILQVLKPLRPLYAPFEFVGKKMVIVINTILLSFVYFTAFAATALIAKLLRKKFLDLSFDPHRASYWMERKKEDYSKKETYRGF